MGKGYRACGNLHGIGLDRKDGARRGSRKAKRRRDEPNRFVLCVRVNTSIYFGFFLNTAPELEHTDVKLGYLSRGTTIRNFSKTLFLLRWNLLYPHLPLFHLSYTLSLTHNFSARYQHTPFIQPSTKNSQLPAQGQIICDHWQSKAFRFFC